jgi:hypothetical protein
MKIRAAFVAMLLSLCALPFKAEALTAFYYTGPGYVAANETVLVTPEDGFTFEVSRNYDNGVSFAINDFATTPFGQNRWWYLDFAAPDNVELTVGLYTGATRFPFQQIYGSGPGLSFTGNGRGDNTLRGAFNILDVSYAPDGTVLTFAADFIQFDEGNESWWSAGAIRYNYAPAVPEPSTWALLVAGIALLVAVGARRRRM